MNRFEKPDLSIIIACHNDGTYLQEAVASARFDHEKIHEIIIVNDGSNDSQTLQVLQEMRGKESCGIQVIDQPNSGPASARNTGIKVARGRYILPLDSDNRIRSEYIKRGIEILDQDAALDVVYSDAQYFGQKSGRWCVPQFNLRRLLEDNYIDTCAVYRRSAWKRCGGYDESEQVRGREDWDFWVRIALTGGCFYHIAQPLFDYRVREDSLTTKVSAYEQFETARSHIYAKRIEMTINDYVQPYHSFDFVLDRLRRKPLRVLLALLARAYLPFLLPVLSPPSQPNDRRVNAR